MGLWNASDYGPFAIQDAVEGDVVINSEGEWLSATGNDIQLVAKLADHMGAMCGLLSNAERFSPFTF